MSSRSPRSIPTSRPIPLKSSVLRTALVASLAVSVLLVPTLLSASGSTPGWKTLIATTAPFTGDFGVSTEA